MLNNVSSYSLEQNLPVNGNTALKNTDTETTGFIEDSGSPLGSESIISKNYSEILINALEECGNINAESASISAGADNLDSNELRNFTSNVEDFASSFQMYLNQLAQSIPASSTGSIIKDDISRTITEAGNSTLSNASSAVKEVQSRSQTKKTRSENNNIYADYQDELIESAGLAENIINERTVFTRNAINDINDRKYTSDDSRSDSGYIFDTRRNENISSAETTENIAAAVEETPEITTAEAPESIAVEEIPEVDTENIFSGDD